jgi:hypothetical protein
MQAILDNEQVFATTPVLGELSCDNYYLLYANWQAQTLAKERNAYIWAKDIYESTSSVFDWNAPYQQILYANLVLEGLDKITVDNQNKIDWQRLRGTAFFLRGYAYYQLVQIFCAVYDDGTAVTDLGLPLKLSANVNDLPERASLKMTYEQIIKDLTEAAGLLPTTLPNAARNRPYRSAAFAQLARTYLSMRAYTKAGAYADSSLQLYNTLIDYNTISATGNFPFTNQNNETLYQSAMGYLNTIGIIKGLTATNTIVDSNLYQSYHVNDLRRIVLFTKNTAGNINARPNYFGNSTNLFSGLATDELYLIRAECTARNGNASGALADLNKLLQNRFKTGTYSLLTTTDNAVALQWILSERRKELCFRGIRWQDIRRLNKEGANITLTRILNGITYTLTPNSPLYVLPIPAEEIGLSGIQQNNR